MRGEAGTVMIDLERHSGARMLLTAAALVVVIYGLREAAPILLPFFLALFLAILNVPLLLWLRRRGCPSFVALLITMLVNAVVLGFLGLVVSRSIESFITALPRYAVRLQSMAESAVAWFEGHGVPAAQWISLDVINPGSIIDFVGGTLRGIAAVLANVFLILLIMVFILSEAAAFPAKLRAALGNQGADLSRLTRMTTEVQRFLALKTLVSLATGVAVGLWVWMLGVDFPLLWGLVAFLFNYIPSIGSVLAAIPAVLVALVQFGVSRAAIVAVGFLGVNIVFGNIVEPNLMGRKLGLSTLVVVLSLIFWGWVLGPIGMLLSVPLTMIVKIMLEHTNDLRWLAILLGSAEEAAPLTAGAPAAVTEPETGAVEA